MAIARERTEGPTYQPKTKLGDGYVWDLFQGKWVYIHTRYYPWDDHQLITRKAVCHDEVHQGPPYREGGPLSLIKMDNPYTIIATGEWAIPNSGKYVGNFCFTPPPLDAYWSEIDDATVATYGPAAWNKFRPARPSAQIGQWLVELRDFPDMLKVGIKRFKDLGSQYLNQVFGWKPFINDLIRGINTMKKLERRIAFIRKNNGKWLQRGGIIKNDSTQEKADVGNMITPVLATAYYPNATTTTATRTTIRVEKVWFKGRMKYYIPSLDCDKAENIFDSALMRRLYGLDLSPALLWELLPWSWFADWFMNMGDNLANLSSQSYDNLVAKYAYVMRHRKITLIHQQDQPMLYGPAINLLSTQCVEHKERAEASPFGLFGDWPNFTASQVAILAALGISRSR